MAQELPPLVARIVADVDSYLAAMATATEATQRLAAEAEAAGVRIDAAFAGAEQSLARYIEMSGEATAAGDRLAASFTEVGAAADRMEAQATAAADRLAEADLQGVAANERLAASYTEVGAAADRMEAQAAAAADRLAATDTEAVAANERLAASYTEVSGAAERSAAAQEAAARAGAAGESAAAAANERLAASYTEVAGAAERAAATAGLPGERAAESAGLGVRANSELGASFMGVSARATTAGSGIQRNMGLIGIAAAAVGVEAVSMGAKFDQAMEQIHTMANASQQEVDSLKGRVLQLGAATGQGPDKLAEALYHLESAGLRGDAAMEALDATARGSTMAMSDVETTTYALVGVLSAVPPDIHNATDAMAFMTAAVGQGDMSMDQFADSIKSGILPTMVSAGMGMRDYAATLATVTDNSTPAEMAANKLKTAIGMMEAPSKQATVALADLGIGEHQLSDDMRNGGMLQAVEDLKSHMENLNATMPHTAMSMQQIQQASHNYYNQLMQDGATQAEAQEATDRYTHSLQQNGTAAQRAMEDAERAFGGSRSAATMLTLVDESERLSQKYREIGTTAQMEQQFQDKWNDTLQQTQVKAAQAKEGLEALGIQIGEDLAPAANAAMTAVGDLGGALVSGSVGARILATVIEVVLGAVIVAYTYKVIRAIATTIAQFVADVAAGSAWVADKVAQYTGVAEAAELSAEQQTFSAQAAADAILEAAGEEGAASDEVIAAYRAQQTAAETAADTVSEAAEATAAATETAAEQQVAAWRSVGAELELYTGQAQAAADEVEVIDGEVLEVVFHDTEGIVASYRERGVAAEQAATAMAAAEGEAAAEVRAGGAEVAAAAAESGTAAGEAQVRAYVAALEAGGAAEVATAREEGVAAGEAFAEGVASTTAAAEAAGAEVGAAEGAGMAAGVEASGAAASTAAAGAAGAAATAGKGAWLGRFARTAGEVGILLFAADWGMKEAGMPGLLDMVKSVVDHVNSYMTGDPLSPSTQAVDAWANRGSNAVRTAMGLVPLYTADGMTRTNATITQQSDRAGSTVDAWGNRMSNTVRGFFGLAPLWTNDGWTRVNAATNQGTQANVRSLVSYGTQAWQSVEQWWQRIDTSVEQRVSSAYNSVRNWFGRLPGEVSAWWNGVYTGAVTWANNLYAQASARVTDTYNSVRNWFSRLPGEVSAWWNGAYTGAVNWANNLYAQASARVTDTYNSVRDWFSRLPGDVSNWWNGAYTAVVTWATGLANQAEQWSARAVQYVINWFSRLPGELLTIGENIIHGLLSGLENAWGAVEAWVTGKVNWIVNAFRAALAIHSPSQVFHEIGSHVVEGLIGGLASQEDPLAAQMARMAGIVTASGRQLALDSPVVSAFLEQSLGGGYQWMSAASSSPSSSTSAATAQQIVQIHVNGTVVDTKGLFRAVQDAALQHGLRNATSGLSPLNR